MANCAGGFGSVATDGVVSELMSLSADEDGCARESASVLPSVGGNPTGVGRAASARSRDGEAADGVNGENARVGTVPM